jgi:Protein of unknown function with HXXEE motif
VTGAARRGPPRVLVWGLPVAVLLHNAEEAAMVARYLPIVRARLPAAVQEMTPAAEELYVALVVVTAIPAALALLARWPATSRLAVYGLLVVAAVLLVNVVWHLGAAVWLGGYAPGVVTAVVINLPVAAVALSRSRHRGLVSRRGVWRLFLIALLLHGPVLIGLFWVVSLMA